MREAQQEAAGGATTPAADDGTDNKIGDTKTFQQELIEWGHI